MGHFTEETLRKFNAMCADGVNFGESPVYDFARCVTSGGKVYGVSEGEQCKVGRKIADADKGEEKSKVGGKMAKLKHAFVKKMGREMTPEELKKAQNLIASIGVPIPAGESAESMLQRMLPKGEKVVPTRNA